MERSVDSTVDSVVESMVDEVKLELSEIDSLDTSEHGQRYEALHQKLQQALSSIDGL